MLSNRLPEPLRLRAENPVWGRYMREVFPTMMSYVPGGINYDMSVSLEQRVVNWVEQQNRVRNACLTARCGIAGGSEFPITGEWQETWDRIRDLSTSGNLRKIRRKWKKTMGILGWDYRDVLWRRPEDGRDADVWANEWKAFRAEIMKIHPGE